MKNSILYLFILPLVFIGNTFGQQISVDNTYTVNELVEDVFLNGTCTEVSNIQLSGFTFPDGTNSWGYFNKNQSNFPLDEGIVLTTGKLSSAPGPNPSILSEGPASWIGDQDLEFHVNINNTYNATYIEFDFVPTANTIRFEYVFASEQYLLTGTAGQCSYTDGFAFLLQDITDYTPVQNLALVPNTNTPVTSSTIRGAGGLCTPSNPQYFDTFNNINSPIAYNGNTIPLMAEATVIPGHTYHIKMVIADQGNQLYDSAVFLKANSFNASINLGENRLFANQNPLCGDETLTLDATLGNNSEYSWTRNNINLNQNTPTINVNEAGIYSVTITQQNGCISTGEITIEKETFNYNENVTINGCSVSGGPAMIYNLEEYISLITNQDYDNIEFYKNYNNGVLSNLIPNSSAYTITQNETIYAEITSNNMCTYISTIHLQLTVSDIDPFTTFFCDIDDTEDGIVTISTNNLSNNLRDFYNWSANYTFTFHYSLEDAISGSNPIGVNFENTSAYQQTIYARVLLDNVCYTLLPIEITVQNSQQLPAKKVYLCPENTAILNATATNTLYNWSTGETTQSIEVDTIGTYSVSYINAQGCELTEFFEVIASNVPSNVEIITTDFSALENSISVIATGLGIYEYSLDGENYQSYPVFSNLEEGAYTVYIRDTNGCGVITVDAAILDYPRFFTPNGDGYNDVWRIKNLARIDAKAKIYIFDRYAKLIVSFPANYAWDGTRKGTQLPATDYWFLIEFSNGKNMRGHFHLTR